MRAIVAALAMLLDAVVAGADPQWVRTLGVDDGFCEFGVSSVEQTADGGYVLAGWVEGCPTVDRDAWIAKLDTNGTLLWQKSYGGNADDEATVVRRTPDGGFLLAGVTKSFADPDGDFWCVRLDANGKVKWQKSYGGKNEEWLYSAEQTSDGGFILVGRAEDVTPATGQDAWCVRINSTGGLVWERSNGGIYPDAAFSVVQVADGGFAFVGWSDTAEATGMDAWLAKINSSGTLEWVKSYDGGTDHDDGFYALRPADDGGYLAAGFTRRLFSTDGGAWFLRLDSAGALLWQKRIGKTLDRLRAVRETSDGFIMAGTTSSYGSGYDEDFTGIKIDKLGNILWARRYGGTWDEGASAVQPTSDGGFILAGVSPSFTGGDDQGLAIRTSASGTISSCTKFAKSFSRRPATPVTTIWDTTFVTALVKPTVKGTKAKTATATAVTATPCK